MLNEKLRIFLSGFCFGIGAGLAAYPGLLHADVVTMKFEREKPTAAKPKKTDQLIKIAIIDTGYNESLASTKLKLCPTGSFDFAKEQPGVAAMDPHGTLVGSTVATGLEGVNYCAVIYQVMRPSGTISAETIRRAFKMILDQGIQAVNLSLTGFEYSFVERNAIERVAKRGTTIFAAAGNDGANLDLFCASYPACYPLEGVYVVGATQNDNEFRAPYSNYGRRVDIWMDGHAEVSGLAMDGTSFAAPRALSAYVYSLSVLLNER